MEDRNVPTQAPIIRARADKTLTGIGILANPYFAALRDGTMPLECFQRTQEQFFFAVTFFSRPMAALMARIPEARARLNILHNIVEEHGEFSEDEFHLTTFHRFLESIGCDEQNIGKQVLWPEVRAFNSVLTTACTLDELEVGICCMGIIEYVFADISTILGKEVVDRGWVQADDLVHYKLHAAIDKRHAEEFFAIVERSWTDGTRCYFIEQGLELGAYIFDRLYRDMYARGLNLAEGSAV